ncbi:double-strand break repair helicase AddA [uncultured Sphingomonas sp.]|uniref:double-strand break repair helicase AddA n=1 Tax=uncultured Sphingomonas sp. TaxID=158754 RepID=UPI0035CB8768
MTAASDRIGNLPPLHGAQRAASDPFAHVWLSASAGTGKTQVLAARVFRLLLRGVDPGAILALTFTKAGAAEMAGRIGRRLAAWVRMPLKDLALDLAALGERPTPEMQEAARTLFAKVLDAPGGGIRIQTIHGFCQGLLAAFPVEAGLGPGFRPLEAREESVLMRDTLASMLAQAERDGRDRPVAVIGALSRRLGEGGAEQFLTECAWVGAALEEMPSGVGPWVRRSLDLPSGDIAEALAAEYAEQDEDALGRIAAANRRWGTATGTKNAEIIAGWIESDPAVRLAYVDDIRAVVFTKEGVLKKTSRKLIDLEPDYDEIAAGIGEWAVSVQGKVARGGYADLLADGLEVGRDYARAYAAAKRRAGGVDFNDLIARTVALLEQPGIGEWVRYKLDQVTEHVLIDEAQDTNIDQWRIIRALVDEFFVGRGIYAPRTRTLFTVGDYKQAIFGFQGTDPKYFEAAERSFSGRAGEVYDEDMPEQDRGLPFQQLSLVQSFRSTKPVLEFVDRALGVIPEPKLGLYDPPETHRSEVPGPGTVTLWPAIVDGGSEEDEEGWIDDAVRENARRIAAAIKGWLRDGLMLGSKGRPLRPEDVMVLVKRRGTLASLLVARLYAEGVPVAGVDRLRLNAPLAVQDLLAAVRFVLQPGDDLSLASLLVSPLMGWTQDELMLASVRRTGSLWSHLTAGDARERVAPLRAMLARADLLTPYAFLEEMLSGELDGRRKLLRRLGAEARDPIEELLNAALAFETTTTPSLQRFLDWFDRGEVEIVRDPSAPLDAVRVMTAHGAKGLQAPLVILADATIDPTSTPRSVLRWTPDDLGVALPVFRPRAAERGGPMGAAIEAADARELEEHWRLFYVAATRAEERLVIAGSLGPRAKGVPPAMSWYRAAADALDALEVESADEDPRGERVFQGTVPERPVRRRGAERDEPGAAMALPDWARRPVPDEQRPPRPLAPSAIGGDAVANPPPSSAMRAAAERGSLMHALFERLPPCPPDKRRAAAEHWLETVGRIEDAGERSAIANAALRVMEDARFAELFGPDSLAEAPITAVVDGGVVSGTVDRLLIDDTLVRVVDFKTTRNVPATLEEVPEYHLRQMAAYVAALRVIFPERPVEAALLYTAGPVSFALPDALMTAHKPRFADVEQS